jgi:hypothetical protein
MLPKTTNVTIALIVAAAMLLSIVAYVNWFAPGVQEQNALATIAQAGGEFDDPGNWQARQAVLREVANRMPGALADDRIRQYPDVISFSNVKVSQRAAKAIARIGHNVRLELHSTTFEESAWEQLLRCQNIIDLQLTGDVFHAGMIANLGQLSGLKKLQMSKFKTDATKTSASLDGLTKLTALELSWLDLTADSCRQIGALSNLRSLRLLDVPISDDGLAHFGNLRSLESFSLAFTRDDFHSPGLTNNGLQFLESLSKLQSLHLQSPGAAVTDDVFAKVRHLTNLEYLILYGVNVSGSGLEHLGQLKKLEVLALVGTNVSDRNLSNFPPLLQLKEVRLYKTPVTRDGIQELSRILPHTEITSDFDPPMRSR